MFAAKNSMNRRPAFLPATRTTAGTPEAPAEAKLSSLFETSFGVSSPGILVYDNEPFIIYDQCMPLKIKTFVQSQRAQRSNRRFLQWGHGAFRMTQYNCFVYLNELERYAV